MAKIIFRFFGLWFALGLSLALSQPALAVSSDSPPPPSQTFCQKVSDFTTKASVQLNDRLAEIKKAQQNQAAELASRRAGYSQKLAQARTQWGEKKALQYDKLMSRAAEPAKKDAVLAFRSGVEAATVERQAKVDSIVASYRAGLDSAMAGRNQAVDQAANDLAATLNQALADAKSSCQADAAATKQALITKIRAARQTFRAQLSSIETDFDKRWDDLLSRQGDLDAATEKFRQRAQALRDSLSDKLEQSAR